MTMEGAGAALDLEVLGGQSVQVVVAKFNLRAPGGIGRLFVAVPQAALMPFRVKLEKLPKREAPVVDPAWSERFRNQIRKAGVEVRAVLGTKNMTLGDLVRLKPGQVIELDHASKNRIRVESTGLPLFWSELGQADGLYTLRVNEFVDHEQEFMDDILPL
jgi:flagellar motor switch protein FliM